MQRFTEYTSEKLVDILKRFQNYHEILKQDKERTPSGIKMELKKEKEIFGNFSMVTEYWEQDVLNNPSALFDEVETVIDIINLELKQREE